MSERILYPCGCASQGDQEWLCKTHEAKQARDEAFLARNNPEPSVPLSAIRALVQQLMADADDARNRGYLEAWNTYQVCANHVAALCPAPPEDQP